MAPALQCILYGDRADVYVRVAAAVLLRLAGDGQDGAQDRCDRTACRSQLRGLAGDTGLLAGGVFEAPCYNHVKVNKY